MMTSTTADERHDEPCDDYVSLLVRAADDSLDADGRAWLDAHIERCEACRAALHTQQLVQSLVATAFEVDPPLGFATRVLSRIEPRERWLDRLDFRRWTWRVSPVAAGLLMAAWVVAADSETTSGSGSADVISAADAGVQADAVRWSDAVDGTDLVSLTWEAEVATASSGIASEEAQQ
jgi:anti-sigma factor RsiW